VVFVFRGWGDYNLSILSRKLKIPFSDSH